MVTFIVIAVVIQVLLTTGVLAAALLVTGEQTTKSSLPKCLAVAVIAVAASYVPNLGFLSVLIWFAALMGVFEKSLSEALGIAIVCWVILLGIEMGVSVIHKMFA